MGSRSEAATLVVRAAAPWSPAGSHELYPASARRLAVSLATIGYYLEYHRGFRGFGELWLNHVLPWLVTRRSHPQLCVPGPTGWVLARGPLDSLRAYESGVPWTPYDYRTDMERACLVDTQDTIDVRSDEVT